MRTASFCIAKSLSLSAIQNFYKHKGYETKSLTHLLQVKCKTSDRLIFFFAHGSLVTWGFSSREEKTILNSIKPFSVSPLSTIEARYFLCRLGSKTKINSPKRFNAEVITLASTSIELKLAVSYGLAQSIKLESYEEAILQNIKKNKVLIEELANKGTISLSSKAISQRKGEIILARSSVNLHSDFLDVPEYFWEHPNLESYYELTIHFLDIDARVTTLNQQLDVLHELFDMLTSQLQHKHASLLEIIIILLIFIEITLTSIQMIFFH